MTAATLRNYTCKDLAKMAKQRGVPGWHAMRKEQLIEALAERANGNAQNARRTSATPKTKAKTKPRAAAVGRRPKSRVQKKISELQSQLEAAKNLASGPAGGAGEEESKDRLVVMVRDPYWLHAYWELSQGTIARVQAAMAQRWHLAKPVLRLFQVVDPGTAVSSEVLERSIEIHGGVNNWYLDIKQPQRSYRVDIGYLANDGTFFSLARSNIVSTPAATARETIDQNWADVAENFDRIYAMSGGYSPEGSSDELRELMEERLQRPMGSPLVTRYGAGAGNVLNRKPDFHFEADAEMVVYGSAQPGSHVTLKGEPVQLRSDGTFAVRLDMPNRRQVIPIVASSRDGVEQHTIVVAVERNTKRMEAVVRDQNG